MRLFAVRLLAQYGGRLGHWILNRLGWVEFISRDYTKPHADGCSGGPVDTEMRVGGYTKRCRACHTIVLIHVAFWEVEGGTVPPEIVRWLVAVMKESVPAGA